MDSFPGARLAVAVACQPSESRTVHSAYPPNARVCQEHFPTTAFWRQTPRRVDSRSL